MQLDVDWQVFWALPLNPNYKRGYFNGFRQTGRTHGNKLYRDGYAEGLQDREIMEQQIAKEGVTK